MARQLRQDFGDAVSVTYHDLARGETRMPEEIASRVNAERLPFPVSAIDGEVVSAGDVSYFALSERIQENLRADS